MTWAIHINFIPPSQGGSTQNLALISQAVSEKKMLEIIVVYMFIALGQGEDNPLGSKFFHKHKSSVDLIICCKFFPIT